MHHAFAVRRLERVANLFHHRNASSLLNLPCSLSKALEVLSLDETPW